jgi:steroid delta-isomerase-like uncharacterized protein
MSVHENKQLVLRFYEEVMNKGNVDVLEELMLENFRDHGETFFGSPQSRDELKHGVQFAHTIFPDLHVGVEDLVGDGDYVGVRGTMRCTQQGDFMGMEATGNELSWKGIAIFRIEDGKIAERWFNSDSLTLAQHLGVVGAIGGG